MSTRFGAKSSDAAAVVDRAVDSVAELVEE